MIFCSNNIQLSNHLLEICTLLIIEVYQIILFACEDSSNTSTYQDTLRMIFSISWCVDVVDLLFFSSLILPSSLLNAYREIKDEIFRN